MCGIIGYIGPQKVIPIILKGLKSIEYRGYDSAGITFYSKNGFQRIRSEGYLSNLESKIPKPDLSEQIGIGHTRWATHGVSNETNAHPQKFENIHVVHNGVIENAYFLKEEFPASFVSQTDTEVIARLIHHFEPQKDFKKAVFQTLKKLKGQFSFMALLESSPNHLIGCRNGPPLIIGLGKNKEFFVSSDLPSLSQWTQNVYILEDKEIFEIQDGVCQFYSFDGTPIKKELTKISESPEIQNATQKSSFPHFMIKEIFDQPSSLQSTLQHISASIRQNNLLKEKIKNSRKLHIIACGSSFYAGLYGKYIIEQLAQIPVEVELASEFQYRETLIKKEDCILFISQSGETADILSCVKKAQKHGAFCIALCNVQNSSLDRMVDETLFLKAGVERAVASTKAFSSSLLSLFVLALELASSQELQKIQPHLLSLPENLNQVLKQNEDLKKLAQTFKRFKSFLFLGRGHHYPISLEGALKLKELAYVHAEGYPFGEMKHGPLALVDDHVLTLGLSSQDVYFNKNLINLEEVKARKGSIITIGKPSSRLESISLHHIEIPQTHFLLSPILEVVVLQLIAYHYALYLGHNPDQPRNLAKSVTVE